MLTAKQITDRPCICQSKSGTLWAESQCYSELETKPIRQSSYQYVQEQKILTMQQIANPRSWRLKRLTAEKNI
jgi:hypothetical protein